MAIRRWRVAMPDENAISMDQVFIVRCGGARRVISRKVVPEAVSPESLDVDMSFINVVNKMANNRCREPYGGLMDKLLTVRRRSHIICAALMALRHKIDVDGHYRLNL